MVNTELDALKWEQTALLQLEISNLKARLEEKTHIEQSLNTTIKLQENYQEKLNEQISQLESELLSKNALISVFQKELSSEIPSPDLNDFMQSLKPVLLERLNGHLTSLDIADLVNRQVEKQLEPHLATLSKLDSIDWQALQKPEESTEAMLRNALKNVHGLQVDLTNLVRELKR